MLGSMSKRSPIPPAPPPIIRRLGLRRHWFDVFGLFIHGSNVRPPLIKDYGDEPSGRTIVQGFPLDTKRELRARINSDDKVSFTQKGVPNVRHHLESRRRRHTTSALATRS